jgi:hypothetical protein
LEVAGVGLEGKEAQVEAGVEQEREELEADKMPLSFKVDLLLRLSGGRKLPEIAGNRGSWGVRVVLDLAEGNF